MLATERERHARFWNKYYARTIAKSVHPGLLFRIATAGDTGYRKIALTVNRKGLLVQSRDGYCPVAKRGAS